MGILLTEISTIPAKMIVESVQGSDAKKTKLQGIFLEIDTKNKNGRVYPRKVMEQAIRQYNEEKIVPKRAWGQLEHINSPQIQLDRVSHLITELSLRDNVGWGVAELLDETPMGRIAIALANRGTLGMSTRGVGTMQEDGTIDEGYGIAAVDIVADPSASKALVETVRENKEWILGADGIWAEAPMKQLIKETDKKFDQVASAQAMNRFLNEMNDRFTLRRVL